MQMTAENIDRAHALTCASKKFSKYFVRSKSFRDEQNLILVKNSSHPRLSPTTKCRKGALLMVHSARTLTVPLLLSSSSRFCFVVPYFLSRELKTSFDAQVCAMPLLGHCTFSLFVPPMRSELPSRARTRTVTAA